MRHRLIPNYIYNPQRWKALKLLWSDHSGLEFQWSSESCVALSLSLGLSEQQCAVSVDIPFGSLEKGSITVSLWSGLEMLNINTQQEYHKVCAKQSSNLLSVTFCFVLLSPDSSVSKESVCSAGDLGSIPGSGRSSREGNGKPLQYPCLENPMDREAWWGLVHGVTKSRARLSN